MYFKKSDDFQLFWLIIMKPYMKFGNALLFWLIMCFFLKI